MEKPKVRCPKCGNPEVENVYVNLTYHVTLDGEGNRVAEESQGGEFATTHCTRCGWMTYDRTFHQIEVEAPPPERK